MVDETRVLRLLRSLTDTLEVLRTEQSADDTRRADPMWLRGIKYAFVVAVENAVDIAPHLCASEQWGPPSDNGDTMRILGEHGVLDAPLARAMRSAVGFRNVLVHDYVEVDDGVVLDQLADLSDLEAFTVAIAAHLETPD
jgi:uncharacterized protein YutE (UPF0331/DUF86 family)